MALGMRMTSLAASAALMGAVLFAALTLTYTLPALNFPAAPAPIEMRRVEEPAPPPREPSIQPPRLEALDEVAPFEAHATETAFTSPTAPSELAGPPVLVEISRPHWLRRPRNLQHYYPRRALRTAIDGEVVLDCLVQTDGFLRCGIVSELPTGWGFAEAALRIAAEHRMSPATRDGAPVEAHYRMRVPFRVE